jgi:hypothetical protein
MRLSAFCGRVFGSCVAAALLAACGGSQTVNAAPTIDQTQAPLPHHTTFHFTGNQQVFDVPAGVKWIRVVGAAPARRPDDRALSSSSTN